MCAQLCHQTAYFSFILRYVLKKSGTKVPRMELVEVGPSMDMVVRRHFQADDSLRKEAMKTAPESTKKEKNVVKDDILGKLGKIYIPDQKVGSVPLANKSKGVKRERREAKAGKGDGDNPTTPKKQKQDSE